MCTSFAQAEASEILAAKANSSKTAVLRESSGKGNLFQYLKTSDWRCRRTMLIFPSGVDTGGSTIFAEKARTKL
jgi:hypothetical protein